MYENIDFYAATFTFTFTFYLTTTLSTSKTLQAYVAEVFQGTVSDFYAQ
jgi:hypothetical protein